MIKNYSRVRLLTDKYVPNGAPRGAVGSVIETYDNGAYEVEFADEDGIDYAQIVACEAELHVEGPDEEPNKEPMRHSAAPSPIATIGA